MKQSSAIFLVNNEAKILLVHPSGKYNRESPWLPSKEEMGPNETPLAAAQRAVSEELGLAPNLHGTLRDLGSVTYKSKSKMVWCFAALYLGKDNEISLDWENDKYGWFTLDEARRIVKEDFAPVLSKLVESV